MLGLLVGFLSINLVKKEIYAINICVILFIYLFFIFFLQGKSCRLAVGSIDNVVSHGTIIEVDAVNHTVHGVPLGEGNIRVAIDTALDEQALLPIPVTGELVTVGQAVGSHVAWPKRLVKLMSDEVKNHAIRLNFPTIVFHFIMYFPLKFIVY